MGKIESTVATALSALCGAAILAFAWGITAEGRFNGAIFGGLVGAGLLWSVRALAMIVGEFSKRSGP